MKKLTLLVTIISLCLGLLPASAQFGQTAGGGSPMDDALSRVFGTNLNFSAAMETQIKMMPQQENITMSGKMYFANGNSRSELDMAQMKGGKIPPEAIAQMKAMGMDKVISISRADKKLLYMIYPGLLCYAQVVLPDAKTAQTNDFKVASTELGKETLDNHPCIKKQYTISNTKTGQRLILTTWNATDLNNSPIKIEQSAWSNTASAAGTSTTMHFTDINLTQPADSLFQPPAAYTKYDNLQTMMQTEMMKKMGGGMGKPPGR